MKKYLHVFGAVIAYVIVGNVFELGFFWKIIAAGVGAGIGALIGEVLKNKTINFTFWKDISEHDEKEKPSK